MPAQYDHSFLDRIPQPESPVESMARAQQLQNLRQQYGTQQIENQQHQLALEQAQRASKDDIATRAYYQNKQRGNMPLSQIGTSGLGTVEGPNQGSGEGPGAPIGAPTGAPIAPQQAGKKSGILSDPGDIQGDIQAALARGNPALAAQLRDAYLKQSKEQSGIDMDVAHASEYGAQASHFGMQTKALQADAVARGFKGVIDLPQEQQQAAFGPMLARLQKDGYISPEDAAADLAAGPADLVTHYNTITDAGKRMQEDIAKNKEAQDALLRPHQLVTAQADAEIKATEASQFAANGMLTKDKNQQDETGRHNKADEGFAKQRVGIAAGELGVARARQQDSHLLMEGVQDKDALETAARGVLSGLPVSQFVRGRGKGTDASAQKILGTAARMAKEQGQTFDIAAAQSNYKAENASNVDMTKTYNNIKALHNIVGANLDYAIESFAKLPDSKSKLLNMPMRLVTDKMLGNGPQSEALAALMSASRESARLTNNFGSTEHLTDSARHAMDKIHDPNMTMEEFLGAARAIKTDANNVEAGYRKGRDQVRANISAPAAAKPAAGKSRPPLDSFFKQ